MRKKSGFNIVEQDVVLVPGSDHKPAHFELTDGKVTLIAKDYRDGAVKKPVTLGGVEFLRRFSQHILPTRFVKIRH